MVKCLLDMALSKSPGLIPENCNTKAKVNVHLKRHRLGADEMLGLYDSSCSEGRNLSHR